MNTTQLQKQHPQAYEQFFNSYQTIISIPYINNITGLSNITGIQTDSLSHKMPLRLYVGINTKHKESPKNIPYTYYKDNTFTSSYIDYFFPIDTYLLKDIGIYQEIGFLAEFSHNNLQHITILLILLKLINNKLVTIEQLTKLDKNSALDLANNIYTILNEIKIPLFKKLLYNESIVYNSIMPTKSFMHIQYINKKIKIIEKDNTNYFNNINLSNHIIDIPLNTNNISKTTTPILKKDLINIEKIFSQNIFNNICDIYETKYERYQNLFSNIKRYNQIINNLISDNTKYIDDIIQTLGLGLKKYIHSFAILQNRNLQIRTTKQQHISDNTISDINNIYKLNIKIDYASYKDGFGNTGLQIHQNITQKVYSRFCSQYILKVVKGQEIIQQAEEYDNAIRQSQNGLLLNTINNKIVLLGEKLTSRDILSQTTTIDILKILIKNKNNTIHNTQLPPSSYSKNKNEMLGKIILPLVKLIKKRTGIELPLKCSGTLSDFDITLQPTKLPIHILEKIY